MCFTVADLVSRLVSSCANDKAIVNSMPPKSRHVKVTPFCIGVEGADGGNREGCCVDYLLVTPPAMPLVDLSLRHRVVPPGRVVRPLGGHRNQPSAGPVSGDRSPAPPTACLVSVGDYRRGCMLRGAGWLMTRDIKSGDILSWLSDQRRNVIDCVYYGYASERSCSVMP